ncbi:hypothetical protein H1P_510002 [Hyella patelloides LEGE 07179]|uniref:Uncharacterized protein n=1 Tax=Hyella patelloides LEGE 07179 TaxID=945734 RepID=A0A563VZP3_9CYAN|nr:hypothetical protein H1P_510002 [Hyella patelloides LEGE 07179]
MIFDDLDDLFDHIFRLQLIFEDRVRGSSLKLFHIIYILIHQRQPILTNSSNC